MEGGGGGEGGRAEREGDVEEVGGGLGCWGGHCFGW